MAICPSCKQNLQTIRVESPRAQNVGNSWKGTTFVCPHCNAVLSASLDPLAISSDIVNDIAKIVRNVIREELDRRGIG